MNKADRKIDILLAFLINALFLFIYLNFFELVQVSNDDFALSFLVEGAYGERSEYLIYQNVLWGNLLVFLYGLFPGVKWYLVTMYGMLFLSFWGMVYVLLRKHGRKVGTIFSAITLLYCGFNVYVHFHYSKAATIAVVAGVILLFYALKEATGKWEKICAIALGVLFAVWGSFIHFQMFIIAIALMATGILGYKLWELLREKNTNCFKQLGAYVVVFLIVGLLGFSLQRVDKALYADEEWKKYIEFNTARTELWGYELPAYYENLDLYVDLGISEVDYSFFNEGNIDSEVLDVNKMMTLIDAREDREGSFAEFSSAYPSVFLSNSLYVLFIVLAVYMVCVDKRNWFYALCGFCGVMLVQFCLYTSGHYGASYIEYGMWATVVILLLYCGFAEKLKEVSLKWLAIIVAFCIVFFAADYERKESGYVNLAGATSDFFELVAEDEENLYVMLKSAPSIYDSVGYWEECTQGNLSNVYNAYGWESMMPVKEKVLDKYNVENVFRDGINNKNVFYCVGMYSEMFMMYIQDNYDENTILYYEKEILGVPVYSLRTIDQIEGIQ